MLRNYIEIKKSRKKNLKIHTFKKCKLFARYKEKAAKKCGSFQIQFKFVTLNAAETYLFLFSDVSARKLVLPTDIQCPHTIDTRGFLLPNSDPVRIERIIFDRLNRDKIAT